MRCLSLALAALALSAGTAHAYSFEQIASGFVDPTYVTSAPGDPATLYVVEQRGTIEIVRGGSITGRLLDISDRVLADGERGLLSMAFHPRYAQNHLFYVDYTDLRGDTHVVEYSVENGVAVPASGRELLFVQQPYPNHNGGQLQFDKRGTLYVGMGDGGTPPEQAVSVGDPENRAQNPAGRLGKLLRIDPTLPGATWQTIGMGLRNPWRFSFDRLTGNLFIGDVGAATAEEVDFRPKKLLGALANYGWSHYEGRVVYNPKVRIPRGAKVVSPTWTYSHSRGSCSIIGGYVYRGKAIPKARGRYFFSDLCSGVVWAFRVGAAGRASAVTAISGRLPNITSFGEDASGELYATTLDGGLYRLR
jgi:glucose/arabinose dehydrogenase